MIEKKVSQGIISTYFSKLERNLDLDVAIPRCAFIANGLDVLRGLAVLEPCFLAALRV